MIREGSAVTYVGGPIPVHGAPGQRWDLSLGDQGRVLADVGSGCHVRWITGGMKGSTTLMSYDDLVPVGREVTVASALDDSLDDEHLMRVAAREVYDLSGPEGLLGALADQGVLSSLAGYAEDALGTLTGKIRQDPVVIEALSSLDADEQDSFMSYLATSLLRDATRED